MTTLQAWVGVDSRGPSSIYIATDSRVTWTGTRTRWDRGRKTLASRETPHIFGYWGHVLFPALALPQIMALIDADVLPGRPSETWTKRVQGVLRDLWLDYPKGERRVMGIAHAYRLRQEMASKFHLDLHRFSPTSGWTVQPTAMPTSSSVIALEGSGRSAVRRRVDAMDRTPEGGTSRAHFRAFASSLAGGEDEMSGGPPQLCGLRRIGNGVNFGCVFEGRRYFAGVGVSRVQPGGRGQWVNDFFEITDPHNKKRVPGTVPYGGRT